MYRKISTKNKEKNGITLNGFDKKWSHKPKEYGK